MESSPHKRKAAEAEQAVLGACLRENKMIPEIMLKPEHFQGSATRLVFQAILDLFSRDQPADLVTVAEWLKKQNAIEEVGYPFLGSLWDAAPDPRNAGHYAEIVRQHSICAKVYFTCVEIMNMVDSPYDSAENLLDMAEQMILEIRKKNGRSQTVPLVSGLDEFGDRLDAIQKGEKNAGLLTGFVEIDNSTGGMHPGELTILAARPSLGKTALALNIACNVAKNGNAVFFASLEQPLIDLACRVYASEGRINSWNLKQGALTLEEREKLVKIRERVFSMTFEVDAICNRSMLHIAGLARRLRTQKNIQLIVVDYLQLIEPESRKENRQEQVALISRKLKQMARENEVPVLALAQLNRAAEEKSERPTLANLRDSGMIEADADVVMLMYRPDTDPQSKKVGIFLAKHRNGPTAELALTFNKSFMRFENYFPEA